MQCFLIVFNFIDNDNVYRSKRATKGTEGARTVAELQESPTDTNADHQDKVKTTDYQWLCV